VTALAAGEVDLASAEFTAAAFNLAGKGVIKIVAAQAREKRDFEGNEIVASPAAYARASRSTTASPNSAKSRHAQRGNPLKSRLASLTEA